MYSTQHSYSPSADTLYVDIKDIIEQKFPRLDQDIIDDAVAYGAQKYRADILSDDSEVGSDYEAETFFFNSVMERIHERIRSRYDTLIELMLARERHPRTPLRSDIAQDLTSGFISLPSRPIEMIAEKIAEIAEENRNKLTPQRLQFPILKTPIQLSDVPTFLSHNNDRINKFWSLGYKLKKQIIAIERSIMFMSDGKWSWDWRPDVKIKIFDEIYRLAQLKLNANVLERLILDSVMHILDESYMAEYERINFIHFFENTINNQENRRYCRIYRENRHRLWKGY
jgi:hypothetical protein